MLGALAEMQLASSLPIRWDSIDLYRVAELLSFR